MNSYNQQPGNYMSGMSGQNMSGMSGQNMPVYNSTSGYPIYTVCLNQNGVGTNPVFNGQYATSVQEAAAMLQQQPQLFQLAVLKQDSSTGVWNVSKEGWFGGANIIALCSQQPGAYGASTSGYGSSQSAYPSASQSEYGSTQSEYPSSTSGYGSSSGYDDNEYGSSSYEGGARKRKGRKSRKGRKARKSRKARKGKKSRKQ